MLQRFRQAAVVTLLLSLSAGLCTARGFHRSSLYILEKSSTFQRGCFPPCDCPMMETAPVTGTFRLDLVAMGDGFDFYEVRNIRWKVRGIGGYILITGSGSYKISAVHNLQEIKLNLVVGGEPRTLYQSVEGEGIASFPRIAVPISIHGGYCFDTVIDLRARPVRRSDLRNP